MSRLAVGAFQFARRSIISHSSRRVRSMMAAASSSSETDVRDNPVKEDADDLCRISDSEPATDTELSNGNSLSGSKISDDGSVSTSSPKQHLSVDSGSRMPVLGQEKDYSLCGILFANKPPKRQFHSSLWNNSDEVYRTRQKVVSEEKG